MALFRLLHRQGLLQGDINYLQRYALQEVIKSEIQDENKRESMRFKAQAAIAFPNAAAKIFAQSESEPFPDIEEFDPNNPHFSQESIDAMLAAFEEFGFHIEDM